MFPKGAYPRLEFCVDNVKTLCMYCHLRWWHKNPIEAYEWFTAKFPERDAALRIMKQNQSPLTEDIIKELIKETEVLIEKENHTRNC